MPEIDTYKFNHREILELLVKSAGVHDGEWVLQVNFGFTAGNFGSDEDNSVPGAIVIINNLGITRAKKDSPRNLVINAAEVNPAPSNA